MATIAMPQELDDAHRESKIELCLKRLNVAVSGSSSEDDSTVVIDAKFLEIFHELSTGVRI